ncbi:MAG: cellulase family glycosylhydrolase [Marinilabiliaceae bacterium]
MKKYILLFLLFCFPLLLLGCEESGNNAEPEEQEEISLDADPVSLEFTAEGGEKSIAITSNTKWNVNFHSGSWARPSLSASEGDATIKIMVDGNTKEEERSVQMVLSAGEGDNQKEVEISVTQDAAQPSDEPDDNGEEPEEYIEPDQTGVEKDASQLAVEMIIGWNIGNTLEVPASDGGETGWGNPEVTQQLIDKVQEAGFNAIRIPCAWDSYADEETAEIDDAWLERVQEVVDYCVDNDMYVILNSHWDGGWLEENPLYDKQDEVNARQEAYWKQIAIYFRDYDERLLFAGTNEVREDYGEPSSENIEVQESYNQTFVDAVRSTGGKNAYRNLIVQTYNTNIAHGLEYFTLPEDEAEDRLMVEVHYYDPYNFTLNSDMDEACTQWGEPFAGGDVCDWEQESHVDDQFSQLKETFVDQGVPVIMGEYGVIKRTSLSGQTYEDHVEARNYYLEYVTGTAVDNGITPFYWDNGHDGDGGFALFDRSSGEVVDELALDALLKGAGVIE